jgi:broad specificity phosphatase PhoE
LVRHAEKDTSKTADTRDPELNDAGRQRAEKLKEALRKYKPDQIFSTNTRRTRTTAMPTAWQLYPDYRLQIQLYDSDKLEAFAERLRSMRGGAIVVVGHSNTTPTLVNLLLKKEKYKWLADNEHDKIFVVKVRRKKTREQMISY